MIQTKCQDDIYYFLNLSTNVPRISSRGDSENDNTTTRQKNIQTKKLVLK